MLNITYTRHGDYLLPDIILSDPPGAEPLTKYGIMRRSFLKQHRTILYNQLLLSEQLYPHLRETQQAADERLDTLMEQLTKRNPPPDIAADGIAWAAHMNTLKSMAEESIFAELIYE